MPKLLKTWKNLPSWMVALLLLVPVALSAQEVDTSDMDDGEEYEELEAFFMTGSRIKRLDVVTVNPVVALSADDIDQTGFSSVADALRALPFNSGQALVPTDAGTSFTPGISTMNLRGLGNNNTLTLVNGRRGVPYAAPGFDGLQTMFDYNSIPEAAIESIEILKDGASAIYGSDAVSGVVNIILKDDYEGLSTGVEFGNYVDFDAWHYEASVVTGVTSAKMSSVTAVSASFDEQIFAKDVDYAADADHSGPGGLAEQAGAHWEHIDADGNDISAQLDSQLQGIGIDLDYWENSFLEAAPTWFDLRSSRGFPGYLTYGGRFTYDAPEWTPTLDEAVGGYNPYNYQATSGFNSEVKKLSFYNRTTYNFSDTVTGFMEFTFARVESQSRSAGTPVDIESSNGLYDNTPMYFPAENPFNPTGEDIYNGRRRFVEMGNRISNVQSDTPRIVVGAEGTFLEGWNWDAAVMYGKNTVAAMSYAAVDYKLQQAMLGLGVNADGSMYWDPAVPVADRTYFNWFGANSAEMIDFITVWNPNSSESKVLMAEAHVAGSILELPAGEIGIAAGVEMRRESLENIKSDLNATRMILGGSEGTGFFGERDINSMYVEVSIPVLEDLEVQLAGRYEDYSDDGFESDLRPKVAFKYQPLDWLLFRASYSESFKAPDLAYLYTASSTSFSSFQFVDPVTFEEIDQIQVVTSGNEGLAPELTDSYYVGLAIEPDENFLNGWLDGLVFSVDYFQLEQTNLLAQLSDFYGYGDFISGAAEGDPLFADKVVRDPTTNGFLYLKDLYENLSEAEYNGWDITLTYTYETENLGTYFTQLTATYLEQYSIDGDNIAGTRLYPRLRANWVLAWNKGDWSASVFVNYIKGRDVNYWDTQVAYYTDLYFGEGVDPEYYSQLIYTVDDQYTVNPRVSYTGLWDSRITLGVNNVFNENPPADPQETAGATVGVNYVQPMHWYLQWEKDF